MNMKCAELDHLFDAIQTLSEKDEFYAFFQDLCTIDELHEMGQRFEVARLLDRGENYNAIRESTGVSAGTISRIKRAYQYGTGGYKLAIKRFNKLHGIIYKTQND